MSYRVINYFPKVIYMDIGFKEIMMCSFDTR